MGIESVEKRAWTPYVAQNILRGDLNSEEMLALVHGNSHHSDMWLALVGGGPWDSPMDTSTDDGHRRMALFFSVEVEFRERGGTWQPSAMAGNGREFLSDNFLTLKPRE